MAMPYLNGILHREVPAASVSGSVKSASARADLIPTKTLIAFDS